VARFVAERVRFASASEAGAAFLQRLVGLFAASPHANAILADGPIQAPEFRWLLGDTRAAAIPLILETPQQHYGIADDDPSPDPYDMAMVKLLSSMVS
jgi:hypothetical protein